MASLPAYYQRKRSHAGPLARRSETGMIIAHFGVGLFLIGASLTNPSARKNTCAWLPVILLNWPATASSLKAHAGFAGPNYVADEGEFIVYKAGERVTSLYPQKRRYSSGQVMTEAALDPGLTRDLYVGLGDHWMNAARPGPSGFTTNPSSASSGWAHC